MLQILGGSDWIWQKSHKYCQEPAMIYKNLLGNTAQTSGKIRFESVKNMLNLVKVCIHKFCVFSQPMSGRVHQFFLMKIMICAHKQAIAN